MFGLGNTQNGMKQDLWNQACLNGAAQEWAYRQICLEQNFFWSCLHAAFLLDSWIIVAIHQDYEMSKQEMMKLRDHFRWMSRRIRRK